ncbi:MAG TPA: hypothetical protein VK464_10335 [Symbiobacteriaceae bacterium]|jgi:hypothetical protein|nr:hypothetical protein [Symbiobacteriaceae bacterium]
MKIRRVMAILMVVGFIVAGLAWGFRGERRTKLVLASDFVETGPVALRVDRFEQVGEARPD